MNGLSPDSRYFYERGKKHTAEQLEGGPDESKSWVPGVSICPLCSDDGVFIDAQLPIFGRLCGGGLVRRRGSNPAAKVALTV